MSFLKFATWNVRGLRDRAKQRDILAFAHVQGIDVLFIQETNFRTPLDVSRFRREFQVDAFFSLTTARACGVEVIFVTGRFRQWAFCTFGANGRMLMLDIYVNGKRFRFVNVYAPVTRTNTNNFFQDLHQSLSEPLPHVLLGDLNCVIDSQRDVRGSGRGRSTYQAKELIKCSALIPLPANRRWFAPLNGVVPHLLPSCNLSSHGQIGRSDHLPLATTLSGFPGPCRDGQGWRLDSALLQDDDSIKRIRERLQESVANAPDMTPLSWETLKEEWRRILQEEGRARKRRITAKMNEILRRIRIVKGAESLTACTRSYVNSLEVEYARLLQRRARRPPKEWDKPANPILADPNEANGNGSVRITRVKRTDGSSATDPDGISLVFRDYFAALFRDTYLGRGTDEKRLIEKVCRNLVRLEGEETASLGGEATAEELSKMIGSFLWEGKPAPVRRTLLQLPESEGGLGLSHVLTTSKVFALKAARALYHASDYHKRSLPERGPTPRPLAESPSSFYKCAANRMRMLEKEAPDCDVDEVPPARIAEEIARHQITPDENRLSRNWKRKASKDCPGIPRYVHDFVWRKNWDVLPTRQRLHKFGIVPLPRCSNCRADGTLAHALFECPAAKPVWRLVAREFKIRPPPDFKRNRGAFVKLVVVCTIFTIWKRRCLAEARRKPVRAAFPAVSRVRGML
ncbi:hypothetical protein HPB52_012805 [Rhipicephalus sanguineus]|uniref:exodeoxyribonuclease III n=1 Tax=Rhipicephalus sanguineus TaxID=34632 RepID=A0A9D4QEW4_RHISA|nr:hypothetical protein HPB52_012805 [Rhipicephalus sanguineus]